MNLADHGDKLVIKVMGVDPDGVPNAVIVEYLRDNEPIEHPAFTGQAWAALRNGGFNLVHSWWKWRREESVQTEREENGSRKKEQADCQEKHEFQKTAQAVAEEEGGLKPPLIVI